MREQFLPSHPESKEGLHLTPAWLFFIFLLSWSFTQGILRATSHGNLCLGELVHVRITCFPLFLSLGALCALHPEFTSLFPVLFTYLTFKRFIFWIFHVRLIVGYLNSYIWFISLNIAVSRCSFFFFFFNKWLTFILLYGLSILPTFLIPSSIVGYLGHFHNLAIENFPSIHIDLHVTL